MIKLFICGISGRLGSSIVNEIKKSSSISLVGGLVSGTNDDSKINSSVQGVEIISDLNVLQEADVVIDCSTSLELTKIREKCEQLGASLIIASTGKGELSEIFRNKSLSIPVLAAPNLSFGIAFLNILLAHASEKKLSLKKEFYRIKKGPHNRSPFLL